MNTLRTYTLNGRKYRAHPECREGFRSDRACGLIYGPYRLVFPDATFRWARDAEEASMYANVCVYCGQDGAQ